MLKVRKREEYEIPRSGNSLFYKLCTVLNCQISLILLLEHINKLIT